VCTPVDTRGPKAMQAMARVGHVATGLMPSLTVRLGWVLLCMGYQRHSDVSVCVCVCLCVRVITAVVIGIVTEGDPCHELGV